MFSKNVSNDLPVYPSIWFASTGGTWAGGAGGAAFCAAPGAPTGCSWRGLLLLFPFPRPAPAAPLPPLPLPPLPRPLPLLGCPLPLPLPGGCQASRWLFIIGNTFLFIRCSELRSYHRCEKVGDFQGSFNLPKNDLEVVFGFPKDTDYAPL